MRFKVLKDFVSSIFTGVADNEHEMELDEPTAKMWTDHGLIEEVKEDEKPAPEGMTADEN
jgi:hypothetical protein